MFYLLAFSTVMIMFGYILDALGIAIGLIILFAIIDLPVIARWEAEK